MSEGPQELRPFYGLARGFSFLKEVQPIFDQHCVGCHNGNMFTRDYTPHEEGRSFSLRGKSVIDPVAKRAWTESYLSLLQAVEPDGKRIKQYTQSNAFINWLSPQGGPTVRKPGSFGAKASPMIKLLAGGHRDSHGKHRIDLSREEMDKIACWIDLAVPFSGDYQEAHAWSRKELDWYRRQVEKQQRLLLTEWKRPRP
jgi:hypothetical protein